MAETAVRSTVGLLGQLLLDEGIFLYGVEDKVEALRDELVWMQRFLKSADAIHYDNGVAGLWAAEIKERVMTAEDIIENFVINVMSRRRGTRWVDKLKRVLLIVAELKALHKAGSHIDAFRSKISMLRDRLQTYVLRTDYATKSHPRGKAAYTGAPQRLTYLELKKMKNLWLINQDVLERVVNDLLDPCSLNEVVDIYASDGLGKTTLAQFVYHDENIRRHFSSFAWVCLSRKIQEVPIVLQEVVASLTLKSTEIVSQMKESDLINEIQEFVQKNSCLVVLDGIQNVEDWEEIRAAFVFNASSRRSKVLLTTSNLKITRNCAAFPFDKQQLPFVRPKHLPSTGSWELLTWAMGGFQPEHFGNEGAEMEKLGKEMVNLCNGLPLAILVLAGILIRRVDLKGWQEVKENLPSFFRRGRDHGRSHMDVLISGYNVLPYYLKTCFLHLANFSEDYEIPVEKLYRMWVAEGLLTLDGSPNGASLWDVANCYIRDLAQAGMVEIMKKGSDGWIKFIRIHSLMRRVCLEKAAAENFLIIIDHRLHSDHKSPILSSYSNCNRVLRLAVYMTQGVKNFLPGSFTSEAKKYLRSLQFFARHEVYHGVDQDTYHDWMEQICNDFQRLRVLDIEGFCLEGTLTKQVRNLILLRYLSLKGTKVSELPSSIGNLRFMQILDLRVSSSVPCVIIPNTLHKLDQLMLLFLPSVTYEIVKPKILRLHTLSCLETLINLEVSTFKHKDLLELGNLRKLSVKNIVTEKAFLEIILKSPAVESDKLRTCYLRVKGNLISQDPSLLSSINCLRRLYIEDKISVAMEDVKFPPFLKSLHLESCELKADPMKILGSLPSLKYLFLGRNSFIGREMICDLGSFPELTMLNLRWLMYLETWEVKGSMLKLEKLVIKNCGKLKRIPGKIPSTVDITCSPCISGIEKYGTCICYKRTTFGIHDYKEQFIGRTEDTRSLVQTLVHDNCKKVALWGAGGVGKAALAKKLCNDPDIGLHFDATAFVRYPQRATAGLPRHILQRLLKDLGPEKNKESLSQKSCNDLSEELQQIIQQRKCLVVFTDLINSDLVHSDKIFGDLAFVGKGSKILLTIHEEPTMKSSELFAYHLKPLPCRYSRDLFKRRLGSILEGIDGPKMLDIGERMFKHCAGHPLSIIMLAGLLSNKKTLKEWESMEKELTSRLEQAQAPESSSNLEEEIQESVITPGPEEAGGASEITPGLEEEGRASEITPHPEEEARASGTTPRPEEKARASDITSLIFALSYDNLPPHLRRCFLFLANFPEDADISAKKFCQMQMDGEIDTYIKSESYLNELVERGMVEGVKRGPTTRISKCRLNIRLHSLCLTKAKERNFLTIINGQPLDSTQPVAVHLNQSEDITLPDPTNGDQNILTVISGQPDQPSDSDSDSYLDSDSASESESESDSYLDSDSTPNAWPIAKNVAVLLNQGENIIFPADKSSDKRVRSILFFPNVSNPEHRVANWGWLMDICNRFQHLRVLDLEGMWMTEGILPTEIGRLTKLTYLSLKGTFVRVLPSSFENLTDLETLDLRVLESLTIPDVLWKLEFLEHLYLPNSIEQKSGRLKLDGLRWLRTLVNLSTSKVQLTGEDMLKNLRKISINQMQREDDFGLILQSLSTSVDLTINSAIINEDPTILSSLQSLKNVRIKGKISESVKLEPGMFPERLKELALKDTQLKDDPFPPLEKLPGLESLCFDRNSFSGKKMAFSGSGFPRLRLLIFRFLSNLEELDMTQPPNCVHELDLVIKDCWRLKLKQVNEENEDNEENEENEEYEEVQIKRRE